MTTQKKLEAAMVDLVRYNHPLAYVKKVLAKYKPKYCQEDAEDCLQEIALIMCRHYEQTIQAWEQNKLWYFFIVIARQYIYRYASTHITKQWITDSLEEQEELKKNIAGHTLSESLTTPKTDALYDEDLRLYEWVLADKNGLTEEYVVEHGVQWDWNCMCIDSWIREDTTKIAKYVNKYMTEKERRAFIHLYAGHNSLQETNIFETFFKAPLTTKAEWQRVYQHMQKIKSGNTPKSKHKTS